MPKLIRIFVNFILLTLIILIIAVPYSVYLIKFKSSEFPGSDLKKTALRKATIANVLKLNNPGDKKYYYLAPENKNLSVGVGLINSNNPNSNIKKWLEEIISKSTTNNAQVEVFQSINYPKTDHLTNDDLNKIRNNIMKLGTKDLYVIYAGSYIDKETSVGVVIHKDTIFIFKDAIKNLSDRGNIKDIIEKTTLMHEWGHLLGIEHVVDEDCIMNEKVEVLDSSSTGRNLPQEYCELELKQLKLAN